MRAFGRRARKRSTRKADVSPSGAETVTAVGIRPDRWSNTPTFVFAVAGAAIGFKTVLQFPQLAAENGGGAFILIYLLLSLLLGAPLVIAQIMLGRRTHTSPIATFADLGARVYGRRYWAIVGGVAVLAGFIVFSYLSVIAGWTIAYFVRAVFGSLSGLTADGMGGVFAGFVRDPEKEVFWHALFAIGVAAIAARGVRRGLDPAVRWLVPTLYVTLLALTAYAARAGTLEDVGRHLFNPDFTKLTPYTWLIAAAQVFFSLGLGTGVAMMYGAYLKADASIGRAGITVVGVDVLTNIIAATLVFAVLFGGGVAPTSGPNLMFQALPLAFDHLPFGRWAVSVYFAALIIVALLMGMALLEPAIVWLEERFGMTRQRAAITTGLTGWALGLITVFSFNYAAFSFKIFGIEKSLGAFDIVQSLTAELMFPLAALFTAVFAGWLLKSDAARDELAMRSPCSFDAWIWTLRLLAPPLLLLLLVTLYRL
jgi:NSS family neurotransmitter:Na+ symporter